MNRFHAVFPENRTDINLSPMLDVVFIMLIFFIVVASFVREEGIPITLPAGLTVPDDPVAAGYGIGFSPVMIMPLDP